LFSGMPRRCLVKFLQEPEFSLASCRYVSRNVDGRARMAAILLRVYLPSGKKKEQTPNGLLTY